MQEVEAPARPSHPRVPVLPEIPSIAAVHYTSKPGAGAGAGTEVEADAEAEPMKPQVYTVSGAGSEVAASPMSEVVDNHAVEIDPFSLTETVGKARFEEESKRGVGLSSGAASTAAGAGEEKKGIVREVWSGILDDLLGPKNQGQSSNRSAN